MLLGRRELSETQLRTRLLRRGCPVEAVDEALERLTKDRTVDDTRVARAAARLEAGIRKRGPARVRQRLQALGLDADIVDQAVQETFSDIDENALLDEALGRRLRGRDVQSLDERERARLVRGLVGQGFAPGQVLGRLRRMRGN